MFLNCGRVSLDGNAIKIEIWEGNGVHEFRIALPDVSALLQREVGVRITAANLADPCGIAALMNPNRDGKRKGVVLLFDEFPGRRFSIARTALANVARGAWRDASVSEMFRDPAPDCRRGSTDYILPRR